MLVFRHIWRTDAPDVLAIWRHADCNAVAAMPRRASGIAVLVAVLLVARRARATEGEPSVFQQHPTTFFAEVGLGTPLGWGGAEVERILTQHLALSGGVGMGTGGPQVAFMPRIRVGNRASAATAGVGVSYGKYRREDTCFSDCPPALFEGTVAWTNVEAGIEHRWDRGLALRAFLGLGQIVAGHLTCTGGDSCTLRHDDAKRTMSMGAAVGWSF